MNKCQAGLKHNCIHLQYSSEQAIGLGVYYSGGLGNDGDIALIEICPSKFQFIQKLQCQGQEGEVDVIVCGTFTVIFSTALKVTGCKCL